MEQFKEAHYFHLPSQGNIYTVTDLKLANGATKILVALLKRDIFCFEYLQSSAGSLVPTSKEVSFTYIPSGAEIISIDAFNKSPSKNEFVIGITIIKNSNDSDTLETFLNIYSEWEENEDFDIENIAQNCLNVELNYIPYKLLHTFLVTWTDSEKPNKEIVFVLSGSDNQVHIYRENITDHVYKEIENKEFFPELTKTPSPVVWIDMLYLEDFAVRITAFGCECGYVKLLKVDTKTNKILYNFSTRFGNYISSVKLYEENIFSEKQNRFEEMFKQTENKVKQPKVNLLVVNTTLPAVIFHDVLEYGLSDYISLPRHDNSCILTCSEIADIDFDGHKEILLGNSSEELMLLKQGKDHKWILEEVRDVVGPILHLKYIDICGDGVKELVVMTMNGIHVLKHDSSFVRKILNEKILSLTLPKITSLKL